jgi:rhamnulose-1-phosphate aldolase/alcohol dehydrogenase
MPTYKHVTYSWDDSQASTLDAADRLVYRSNILGADQRITNTGGGNTSSKIMETDPLTGEQTEVLWVKGSGGDLRTSKRENFSSLYQDKLIGLQNVYASKPEKGLKTPAEDEMVGMYFHTTFNLNPRASSIDTPLHSFISGKHVDHMHPNAIIAIAASKHCEKLTKEIFGGEMEYVPWMRPGFELGLAMQEIEKQNPATKAIMMGQHGFISWDDDDKKCYSWTLDCIEKASEHIEQKYQEKGGDAKAFGGQKYQTLPEEQRRATLAGILPWLRGQVSQHKRFIGTIQDDEKILRFVNSADAPRLAELGTSCPDHFLRTKIKPLYVAWDPQKEDLAALKEKLEKGLVQYRKDYESYYNKCKHANSPAMRDPNPTVVLIPGLGMIAWGKDKSESRVTAEFYNCAVEVMRGAEAIDTYISLPQQEAFDIEYWLLEEAKLQRMPAPRPMVGRIALVTGGAGGIGAATAARLLREGACVMLADRDGAAVEGVRAGFAGQFGPDAVRAVTCDVTDEAQVSAAFAACALEFGGLDMLVANAGIASSAPIEDTTLELWDRNFDVLAQGYFLTARAAWPLLKRMQDHGGTSVVFIGSKNAVAAAAGASAYASAKAAANHLARCLALEGAPHGIRVNVVNPDAVIRGSRIWDGDWRRERAGTHGIDPGEALEEHYRNRSMLKRDVLPEDVAEAACWLASDLSAKSTGNMINVDAGNAQAFVR